MPKDLWDQVQQGLTANRTRHHRARAEGSAHRLVGRLWDDRGHLMVPTYTRKANGQQYRYYVSQCLMDPSKGSAGSVARISAEAIEQLVEKEVSDGLPPAEQKKWRSVSHADRSSRLRASVAKVVLRQNDVEIQLTDEARQLSTRLGSHQPRKTTPSRRSRCLSP